MTPTIAVVAPGGMGAAVGAVLAAQGARVITSLEGRSRETAERAKAAGMVAATDAELAGADFLLSIVPPKEALPLARRLAPSLRASNTKPLYLECNAVSPDTAQRIAEVVVETGCPFVDAGIIGAPPKQGQIPPRFYVSGVDAQRARKLGDFGLDVRAMDGAAIGDASAVKLCYATLTKGLTALGAASAAAASRAGVADALHAELAASQPAMLAFLNRGVPSMFSKAYRWVAEMEEIAAFLRNDAERQMFLGVARFYERLAADYDGAKNETGAMGNFFAKTPSTKPQ